MGDEELSSRVDGTVTTVQTARSRAASLFGWMKSNTPEAAGFLTGFKAIRTLVLEALEGPLPSMLQLTIRLHGVVPGIVGALVSVFNGIGNLIGLFNDTSHEAESAKRALKQDVGPWPKAFA